MTPDELDDECNTEPCAACDGSGRSVDGRWLWAFVHYIILAGDEGSKFHHGGLTPEASLPRTSPPPPSAGRYAPDAKGLHPWLRAIPIAPRHPRNPMAIDPPTREMARLVKGLVGREGHDPFAMMAKIVLAAGLPESWGVCTRCDGHGFLPLRSERYG